MELFTEAHQYDIGLVIVGLAALGAAVLPRIVTERPISFPLVYLAVGLAIFALPVPGLDPLHPLEHLEVAERVTELGVIIALTGLGLKIDRPFSWGGWTETWRLLAVTMPLTIALAALLGWWAVGLAPAAAMLFGAVLAPTDPVLAADVQSGEPTVEEVEPEEGPSEWGEDEVRFSLTSEAGLNDGLAFPFTNAAIAMAVAGAAPSDWFAEWFLVALVMKVTIGVAVGFLLGRGLARLVFLLPAGEGRLAQTTEGLIALAVTLLVYGATELLQGYGFIAVFVAALSIREYERKHEYHRVLHHFADQAERFLMAIIVFMLAGWIVAGLLGPLTWAMVLVALALVFVVRPVAGLLATVGHPIGTRERLIVSFFGIRGIGSLYYLSHGLAQAEFPQQAEVWALLGFTVVLSIVVHGLTTTPVMQRFERWQEQQAG